MAALRSGISTVIIPKANEKDLEEIDQTVRGALRFVMVEQADEVLGEALAGDRMEESAHPPAVVEELSRPSLGITSLRQ